MCNRCQSTELAPQQVSGQATLYAWCVVMQAFHPYFVDRIPYTLAVVELVEEPGLRMTTNILDCPEEDLQVGMPVQVAFTEVAPGVVLPMFRRA
jgi:uncharacterized OB-fold protein